MSVTGKVKAVLYACGKKQIELAEHFNVGKQSMNNKMARGSWSAKDLAKVAEFCGCKLAFVLPDGTQICIDAEDEKCPDA